MTLTVQRLMAIVVAIAVGGLAVVQAGEQASDSGAGTPGKWECWDPDSPNPCRHDLNAVSIVSETDAWAVGASGHIQRWNGRQWEAVSNPCSGNWRAVDMLAHNDGWAVCSGDVFRWDGMTWSRAHNTPDDFAVLTLDIHASDHGWAGGLVFPGYDGGMYHWDGSQWLAATAAGAAGFVEEIDVLSPSDAWAVIWDGRDVPAMRWDGARWTGMSLEVPGSTTFNGIAMVSGTDGWIIGESLDELRNLAYRWDGTRWSRADFGPFGEPFGDSSWWYPTLNSIHASSAGDVWVAGDSGAMGRFDGSVWSVVDGGTTLSFEDVRVVAPDNGWAVGSGGVTSHWDGYRWSAAGSIEDAAYLDIHMTAEADGWAVGHWRSNSDGTRAAVFRWNGADWRLFAKFGDSALYAMDFASHDDGWAVGGQGTILHWDGTSWAPVESGTTSYLYDVAAVGRDDAWAVGQGGAILHWDGSGWTAVDIPTAPSDPATVRAVDFLSSSDGWASWGSKGDMLHWDGVEWRTAPSPADRTVNDILLIGPDDGWAVCAYGEILHWDGNEWTVSADVDEDLEVVAMNGPDEVWAAGMGGNVYRWDGRTWSHVGSDSTEWIQSMAFSPSGDGWAGSFSDLLMRYVPEATATPDGPDPGSTPIPVGPHTIYAPDGHR